MSSRRAYRYEVIATEGAGVKAIGDSPYIIDWSDLGDEYTWNIVGGASMESRGFITGRFVDKGCVGSDGVYVADAGVAAASETKRDAGFVPVKETDE